MRKLLILWMHPINDHHISLKSSKFCPRPNLLISASPRFLKQVSALQEGARLLHYFPTHSARQDQLLFATNCIIHRVRLGKVIIFKEILLFSLMNRKYRKGSTNLNIDGRVVITSLDRTLDKLVISFGSIPFEVLQTL